MGAGAHEELPVVDRPNPYKGESFLNGKIVRAPGPDKINYPKHVWSPAGGWYTNPSNWKGNTAKMGLVIVTFAALAFSVSADREKRYGKTPREGVFFPSKWWSRELREDIAKKNAS